MNYSEQTWIGKNCKQLNLITGLLLISQQHPETLTKVGADFTQHSCNINIHSNSKGNTGHEQTLAVERKSRVCREGACWDHQGELETHGSIPARGPAALPPALPGHADRSSHTSTARGLTNTPTSWNYTDSSPTEFSPLPWTQMSSFLCVFTQLGRTWDHDTQKRNYRFCINLEMTPRHNSSVLYCYHQRNSAEFDQRHYWKEQKIQSTPGICLHPHFQGT